MRFEAKVGLVVFAGILVFIGVYWFLGGMSLTGSTFPVYSVFKDVMKLDKGADVRMAGVKIGLARNISLTDDNQVRIDMVIYNRIKIPVDSTSRISTGAFIGEAYVEIIPGKQKEVVKAGQKITSGEIIQFAQVMESVDTLLKKFQKTADSINSLLSDKDMMGTFKSTLKNIDEATRRASEVVASAQGIVDESSPELKEIFSNLNDASCQTKKIAAQIEQALSKDARPGIKKLMDQAQEAMVNLNNSIKSAQDLIDTFKGSSGKVEQTLDSIASTSKQAEEMMTKLNDASSGVRELAIDPELKENIRKTLKNAADASEEAKDLLNTINKKIGGKSKNTNVKKTEVPEEGARINALWNTDKGSYRLDANYTLAASDNSFYRLGAYNIGENTKLNLQTGKMLDRNNSLRYGLYASRIGIGYDRKLGNIGTLSADLFRPNDPELELKTILNVNKSYGLYGGISNVLDKDQRDLMIGIRYKK